jgi:energy-coupling factor transporter transmembrane protein EcfT
MPVRRGTRNRDSFSSSGDNGEGAVQPTPQEGQPEQEKPTDKKSKDLLDRLAYWLVLIISVPFRFFASVAEKFVDRAGPGAKLLGAIAFILGAFLSADSYWQSSGGSAIFPWFETDWYAWNFLFLLSPVFWICLIFSFLIQLIQARTVRGMTADKAKEKRDAAARHQVGNAPTGAIDVAGVYHKAYKTAGVRQVKFIGIVALASWGFDLVMAFASRNPWALSTNGLVILSCIAYNLFSCFASELGYILWEEHK